MNWNFLLMEKPKDIIGALGGSILGTVTAGLGAHQDNIWAILAGSAIGSASMAWVFGIWLRDRTFQYLRQQNEELWQALNELRTHQAKDSLHLHQQDVDADKRAHDAMVDRAENRQERG